MAPIRNNAALGAKESVMVEQGVWSRSVGPIMRAHLICGLGLAMTACMNDSEAPPSAPGLDETVVYESGPHLAQCAPPALTPKQSATKLTNAGIEVRRSSCGHLAGVAFPAVCGAGTGQVLLHDIPASSLAAARAAGFGPADDIDWQRSACAKYLHAIDVARESASCAQTRNRVIEIQDALDPEERVVLLDQAGTCADAAYRQVLFGGDDGNKVLCSNQDSIAGPQKSCPVASHGGMFDTILANLDEANLGLGTGYYLRQVYPGN
jgi:hypothetical protein